MSNQRKNLLIIDDHRLVADGLRLILSQALDNVSISTSNNVRSVLEKEEILKEQSLVLVDLHMPTIDGYGFLAALRQRKIKVPVIVVSAVENRLDIQRVLKEGAQGFIPKNAPSVEMVKGVKAVLDGNMFIPEHLTGIIDWDTNNNKKSDSEKPPQKNNINLDVIRERQIEVLKLMHSGYSNTDIATVLNLTESTVKSHVSILFKALNVKNRTACVRVAIELELIA